MKNILFILFPFIFCCCSDKHYQYNEKHIINDTIRNTVTINDTIVIVKNKIVYNLIPKDSIVFDSMEDLFKGVNSNNYKVSNVLLEKNDFKANLSHLKDSINEINQNDNKTSVSEEKIVKNEKEAILPRIIVLAFLILMIIITVKFIPTKK